MYTLIQIEAIVKQFQDRTLPLNEWTHEAYLIVCCWHLLHHSVEESICLLRAGIITYNVTAGVENTTEGGYHESLTLFWIYVIAAFLEQQEGDEVTKINSFLTSNTADKNLPLEYYSKELILSTKGRAIWIAPDLDK